MNFDKVFDLIVQCTRKKLYDARWLPRVDWYIWLSIFSLVTRACFHLYRCIFAEKYSTLLAQKSCQIHLFYFFCVLPGLCVCSVSNSGIVDKNLATQNSNHLCHRYQFSLTTTWTETRIHCNWIRHWVRIFVAQFSKNNCTNR